MLYYLYVFYLVHFSINLAETRVSSFKKQCQRISLRQTEGEKSESSIDFFFFKQTMPQIAVHRAAKQEMKFILDNQQLLGAH